MLPSPPPRPPSVPTARGWLGVWWTGRRCCCRWSRRGHMRRRCKRCDTACVHRIFRSLKPQAPPLLFLLGMLQGFTCTTSRSASLSHHAPCIMHRAHSFPYCQHRSLPVTRTYMAPVHLPSWLPPCSAVVVLSHVPCRRQGMCWRCGQHWQQHRCDHMQTTCRPHADHMQTCTQLHWHDFAAWYTLTHYSCM